MKLLTWIIGWLIVAEGVLFLLRPQWVKPLLKAFAQAWLFYLLAVLRAVAAVVFFLAAQRCSVPWLVITLGAVLLIGAIVGFILRPRAIRSLMDFWQVNPPIVVRLLALIAVAFGILTIYAA